MIPESPALRGQWLCPASRACPPPGGRYPGRWKPSPDPRPGTHIHAPPRCVHSAPKTCATCTPRLSDPVGAVPDCRDRCRRPIRNRAPTLAWKRSSSGRTWRSRARRQPCSDSFRRSHFGHTHWLVVVRSRSVGRRGTPSNGRRSRTLWRRYGISCGIAEMLICRCPRRTGWKSHVRDCPGSLKRFVMRPKAAHLDQVEIRVYSAHSLETCIRPEFRQTNRFNTTDAFVERSN